MDLKTTKFSKSRNKIFFTIFKIIFFFSKLKKYVFLDCEIFDFFWNYFFLCCKKFIFQKNSLRMENLKICFIFALIILPDASKLGGSRRICRTFFAISSKVRINTELFRGFVNFGTFTNFIASMQLSSLRQLPSFFYKTTRTAKMCEFCGIKSRKS